MKSIRPILKQVTMITENMFFELRRECELFEELGIFEYLKFVKERQNDANIYFEGEVSLSLSVNKLERLNKNNTSSMKVSIEGQIESIEMNLLSSQIYIFSPNNEYAKFYKLIVNQKLNTANEIERLLELVNNPEFIVSAEDEIPELTTWIELSITVNGETNETIFKGTVIPRSIDIDYARKYARIVVDCDYWSPSGLINPMDYEMVMDRIKSHLKFNDSGKIIVHVKPRIKSSILPSASKKIITNVRFGSTLTPKIIISLTDTKKTEEIAANIDLLNEQLTNVIRAQIKNIFDATNRSYYSDLSTVNGIFTSSVTIQVNDKGSFVLPIRIILANDRCIKQITI